MFSVVSPLFQPDYRFFWFENELKSLRICVAKWILIVHNGFIVVNTGRSQRVEIVIYRVVGRQGVDFERSHQ
jgi:hypothetical protein